MRVQLTIRTATDMADRDIEVRAVGPVTLSELSRELTQRLGLDPHSALFSGGRLLPLTAELGGPGLRSGAVVAAGAAGSRGGAAVSVLQLHVTRGPDCGRVVALSRGRHVLGRGSEADIRIDDPQLSRVHAELEVGSFGVRVHDLASTNGTYLADHPVAGGGEVVGYGGEIRIGASAVVVSSVTEPPLACQPDADGCVLVHRPPRTSPPSAAAVLTLPPSPETMPRPKVPWLVALVPAVLAAAMAMVLHSPQFLMFAALTPVTMLAAVVGDRRAWSRGRRRARSDYDQAEAAARRDLAGLLALEQGERRHSHPDAAAVWSAVTTPNSRLWERRPADSDWLTVRVGSADQPARTTAERAGRPEPTPTVRQVPVLADLRAGAIGVAGPSAQSWSRWLTMQVLALHCPRDVSILALTTEQASHWRWLRWLTAGSVTVSNTDDDVRRQLSELAELVAARRRSAMTTTGAWSGPWIVLLIDPASRVAGVAGLQEVLEHGPQVGVTAICVAEHRRLLPPWCHTVAEAAGASGLELDLHATGSAPIRCAPEGVQLDWAEAAARSLAPLRTPGPQESSGLPTSVRLDDVLDGGWRTPSGLVAAWATADDWYVPLGTTTNGLFGIDLVRDGPHTLVAGSTGSGKSELLRALVAGLAARRAPQDVSFILIDYKGGAAFAECADLPHTLAMVTDLDPASTTRALISLDAELRQREQLFVEVGATDIDGYLRSAAPERRTLPRLVIVVDEFATLAEELPSFVTGLVGIAQRGRSLGVHLVLATQRPAGVVSAEIKANSALRIALRVTDAAESGDVVGVDDAAHISKHTPGRAVARTGDGVQLFQTMRVDLAVQSRRPLEVLLLDRWNRPQVQPHAETGTDLQLLCAGAARAVELRGLQPPRRPWLPPLPPVLGHSDLQMPEVAHLIALGRTDDPAEQRQDLAVHDLRVGGVIAFVGGARSGRTTALRTIAGLAAARLSADDLHLYVLDCGDRSLGPLADLAQCGSLLTRDDPGGIARLIGRLSEEVGARQRRRSRAGGGGTDPVMMLVLDGWDSFVSLSEHHDGGRTVDAALQVCRDAAAAGLTVALTGDRSCLTGRLPALVDRTFVLPLADRHDYSMAGVAQGHVPARSAGLAVERSTGLHTRLAVLGTDASAAAQWRTLNELTCGAPPRRRTAAVRIRALPPRVQLADLPRPAADSGHAVLGVGGDEAELVSIDVWTQQRRFLIAGPARSGRSTTVTSIAAQAHSAGVPLIVAAPRRSPVAAWAAACGVAVIEPGVAGTTLADYPLEGGLLIIDDAEHFADSVTGDLLSALIARAGSGCVAAARSDDLLVSFRGPAVEVRRDRCGVLLQPSAVDGELLGVRLPTALAPGPAGRGLLVTDETRQRYPHGLPVQVAA